MRTVTLLAAAVSCAAPHQSPEPVAALPATDLRALAIDRQPVPVERIPRIADEVKSPDGTRVARLEPIGTGLESRRDRLVITGAGPLSTTIAEVINFFGLAWSPDGQKVAYCEGAVLHIADAAGATTQILHQGRGGRYPGACFDLAWSNDGRTLSLTEVENAEQLDISNPVRLTITLGPKPPAATSRRERSTPFIGRCI
jgi:hypothetical protein